jgi:hypothetical protein
MEVEMTTHQAHQGRKTHLGPSVCERLSKMYPADNEGWSSVKTVEGRSVKILIGTEWVYSLPNTPSVNIITGEHTSLELF